MADTDPAGPVMDRDEVDRALARLGQEHEAIETSLLALQDHAGRRLLEGARLTGVTAERWTSTEAAITLLWTYFDAYTDVLRKAREIRARRRWSSREDLVELTELLRGEPVTVAGSAAATANVPAPHGGRRGRGLVRPPRPHRLTVGGAPAHERTGALRRGAPGRAPGRRRPGTDHPHAQEAA